jgi:hypothetical protein
MEEETALRSSLRKLKAGPTRTCCLIMMNLFFFLLGLIMLIVSEATATYLSSGTIFPQRYVGEAGGLILMMFSVIGICAVREDMPRLFLCYVIWLIVVLLLEMVFAAGLMQVSGEFSFQQMLVSGAMTFPSDISVNNAIYSMFTQCCSGCPTKCNNPNANSYTKSTLSNCLNVNCSYVGTCASSTSDACFNFYGTPTAQQYVPPYTITQSVCSVLGEISYSGNYMVGPASLGGCGGGSAKQFSINLSSYVSGAMYSAGVGVAIIITIQMAVMLYVMCCTKKTSIKIDI